MKPKLYFTRGWWVCQCPPALRKGIGRSPHEAYRIWAS